MKKITSLLLTVSVMLSFTACSEKENKTDTGIVPEKTSEKPVVTIGTVGELSRFPAEYEFNLSQSKYRIQIKDYSKLVEDDDAECSKAFGKLKLDIISGNAPDIISVWSTPMSELIRTGMFEDMYSLMDEYGGISREDFLPNILDGFEIDGKIPAISPNFSIDTAIAKTEYVGENSENWSLEKLTEIYNSLPDDMGLIENEYTDRSVVYEYVSKNFSYDCTDMKYYTCNFNNTDFKNSLDFASSFPEKADYRTSDEPQSLDTNIYHQNNSTLFMNDHVLIHTFEIRCFGHSLGMDLLKFGGQPVTYVGYPSSDGNGAFTTCGDMYAIPKSSKNKEYAWDVISYLINDDNFQTKMNNSFAGLPVLKKHLSRYIVDNSNEATDYLSIYSEYDDGLHITDELVAQAYEYICNVDFDPYWNYKIQNMIDEECMPVIAGERSADECADILQSRIAIYMSELN